MTHDTRTASAEPVRNEAAERLLIKVGRISPQDFEQFRSIWRDALAAERRATVERIYQAALSNSTEIEQRAFNALRVILDKEAAR